MGGDEEMNQLKFKSFLEILETQKIFSKNLREAHANQKLP